MDIVIAAIFSPAGFALTLVFIFLLGGVVGCLFAWIVTDDADTEELKGALHEADQLRAQYERTELGMKAEIARLRLALRIHEAV